MVILRKRVAGLTEAALARFVARAARAVRLHGSTNVLVTTSRDLRALNRRFRWKDKATDVLSFPPMPGLAGRFAGDIAIAGDIAARNARLLGHAASAEIKILALHGLLHLAGYDHERDKGEMARREERLRRVLRLPVGLIERNGQEAIAAENTKDSPRTWRQAKAAGRSARATRPLLSLRGSASSQKSVRTPASQRRKR